MEPSCYLPSILCMEAWLASGRLRETHREEKNWLTAPRNGKISPLQGIRALECKTSRPRRFHVYVEELCLYMNLTKGIKMTKWRYSFFTSSQDKMKEWNKIARNEYTNSGTTEEDIWGKYTQGIRGILFSKSQKQEAGKRIDACIVLLRILACTCTLET